MFVDTVYQLNNYPTGLQAIGIVSTLMWAFGTDIFGRRWLSGYYVAITAICVGIILLVPDMPKSGQYAAYYWSGSIYCIQSTYFALANDSRRHQPPALRAVVIACMNFGGNVFQAWWPLVFYRANDAPNFTVSSNFCRCDLESMSCTNNQAERHVRFDRCWNINGHLGQCHVIHGEELC